MEVGEIKMPIRVYVSITTSINGGNFKHVVKTSTGGPSDIVELIMNTTEEETKKALISLGWAPPKEEE